MTESPAGTDSVPERGNVGLIAGDIVSLHQLAAANMAFYRRIADKTQAELGAQLGWSFRAVSAAERTAARTDGKGRLFDATTLGAIAHALGIPAIALFLPLPEAEGKPYRYQVGSAVLDAADLMWLLVMPDNDNDNPAMQTYRDEFNAAADRWLPPEWSGRVHRWLDEGLLDLNADDAALLRRWALSQRDSAVRMEQWADVIDATVVINAPDDDVEESLMPYVRRLPSGQMAGHRPRPGRPRAHRDRQAEGRCRAVGG